MKNWCLIVALVGVVIGCTGKGTDNSKKASAEKNTSDTQKSEQASKGKTKSGDTATAAAKVDPNAPAGTRAQALLENIAKNRSIEEQEGAVGALHHVESGKKLYNSFQYEEAKVEFAKALRLDPRNDEAKDYYERTMGLLGERIDKVKTTAEWLRQEKTVRIQEIKIELENKLESAKKLYREKQYADSQKNLEHIVERLRWLPTAYTANMEEIGTETRSVLKDVKKARQYQEKKDKIQAEEDAKKLAQRKFHLEQISHNKNVAQLIMQVEDLMAMAKYDKARRLASKILKIDPINARARELAKLASDMDYNQIVQKNIERHDDNHRRSIQNVANAKIPYDRLLVYPEDWERITQREGENLQSETVEPWQLEIQKKMAQPVSFNFDQTPIQNVIEFMRVATNVNLILDQNALVDEDTGDTRDIPISLQVSDMEAKIALDWILKLSNLKSTLKDQAVFISTEAQVQGDVVLQLYDIRDLTLTLQDFPGPVIEVTVGDDGTDVSFEDAEEGESVTPDTIVELIQTNISPESWEEEGVAIAMQAGKMLVSQTPAIHKQVVELLAFFRRAKATQVNLQTRFITINDDLVEELGVNWGNDNSGEGFFDDFTTGNGTATLAGLADSSVNDQITGYNVNNTVSSGTSLNNSGGLNLSYQILNFPKVNFILKAMQKVQKGTVLSSPNITLTNTQRGHIVVADQKAYLRDWDQGDGGFDPQIGTYQIGVVFDVRPIISADKRYITLEMRPTVADELPNSPRLVSTNIAGSNLLIELPQLTIRRVRNTVTIPDKGTLSLGGRLTTSQSIGKSGIPFISNIPWLGRLFSNNTTVDENQSIMILVTGEIMMFNEYEAELL